MDQKLLSQADVEAGCKSVEIEFLDGRTEPLEVRAVDWRQRRLLVMAWAEKMDFGIFIAPALAHLPKDRRGDKFLNQLTPASIARLEEVACALALGESTVKKILAEAMSRLPASLAPGATTLPTASASNAG
jgi:hypothetical protein